jgi:hypothetical protein
MKSIDVLNEDYQQELVHTYSTMQLSSPVVLNLPVATILAGFASS